MADWQTLSDRINHVAPSATLAVDSKAKAMKAAGIDVIGFGAGEPNFPTPAPIVAAAAAAVQDPKNYRYTPTAGLPELRKAIADLVRADVRKPEEIASHLVGFAYASNARLAVVPMQDLLQLDLSDHGCRPPRHCSTVTPTLAVRTPQHASARPRFGPPPAPAPRVAG